MIATWSAILFGLLLSAQACFASEIGEAPPAVIQIPEHKSVGGSFGRLQPEADSEVTPLEAGQVNLRKGEWLTFCSSRPMTREMVAALKPLAPRLFECRFLGGKLPDDVAKGIADLTELRRLDLSLDANSDGSGFSRIPELPRLVHLQCSLNKEQQRKASKYIGSAPALDSLSLSLDSAVTPEVLDSFSGSRTLKRLSLRAWTRLDDNAMSKIAAIAGLTALNIRECTKVTAVGIKFIAVLKLEELDLRGCDRIGDEGAKVLATMKSLVAIRAQATSMSNDGVKELAKLGALRILDVSDNWEINDEGIKSLAARKLEWLNLSGTEVSDASVATLKAMSSLKWLKVDGTPMSETGIAELKKGLPGTKLNEEVFD